MNFYFRRARNGKEKGTMDWQVRILFWWVTIRTTSIEDALKWLGYDEED
jgi:hypothetical protein